MNVSKSIFWFGLFLWLWLTILSEAAVLEVRTGQHARFDTPLSVALTTADVDLTQGIRLLETSSQETTELPCQLSGENPPRLSWILSGQTPAGSVRRFRLVEGAPEVSARVQLNKENATLTLSQGGRNVLRYHHGIMAPPPGRNRLFERSGFIHPLWSPAGTVLSRIHPPDHIHHMGLWAPWTKTHYQDQSIDFWNLNQGQGTVRFDRFLEETSGPVRGGFTAVQNHVWLRAPGGEKTVLRETLKVHAWNPGEVSADLWLVDYVSTLRCATGEPIQLDAYRYGGLGLRGTAIWHNDNSDYLTSEGKTRANGDGTRARWCDVYGETGAGVEGVLFLSHPENREHPEPMRIWPANANGGRENVFFNFCPIRHRAWILEPDRDYSLQYRLVIHSGSLNKERAEQLWRDFAEPPEIRLLED